MNLRAVLGALGVGWAVWVSPAWAQQDALSVGVVTQSTWTSNAELSAPGAQAEDWIVEVAPSVLINTRGARAKLVGEVGASAIHYVRDTARDQVQPRARLMGNLEAVERLLYVDGSVVTTRLAENPLGPVSSSAEGSTTPNVMTTTTYTASPYLDWRASTRTRLSARADETRIATHGDTGALGTVRDSRFSRQQARLEVLPQPLGLTLDSQRNHLRYDNVRQDSLLQDIHRATLSWAGMAQWVWSVGGGHERTEAAGARLANDALYGGGFEWRPGPRTVLRAQGEHRFFGTGWDAALTHRMPFLTWNARAARELTTFAQELFTLNASGNVAQALDAMLTTRYPDAAERARQVQELMRSRGLPNALGEPLTLYTQEAFISTVRTLTVVFSGARSTLSLSASGVRMESARPATISATPVGDTDQGVLALHWGHQLTRTQALALTFAGSRIRSLRTATSVVPSDETLQRLARLVWTQQLSAQTQWSVGARRRVSDSRRAADYRETAVFAVLSTRV